MDLRVAMQMREETRQGAERQMKQRKEGGEVRLL
jgi:hypothetical protein